MEKRPKKLLDQVREAIRVKHYSIRTEEAYVAWIKRYILFHNKRHPQEMGASEIEAFLTHLAVEQHVAASTQNQALSTLVAVFTCPSLWNASIPMPTANGSGNTFFLPPNAPGTPALVQYAAITSTRVAYKRRSEKRPV